MTTHELKTDPEVFRALMDGAKTYAIRRDDRGFAVGDLLVLRETVSTGAEMAEGAALEYTGRAASRTVTHVLRGPAYGLIEGWAILSVNDPKKDALAAYAEEFCSAAYEASDVLDDSDADQCSARHRLDHFRYNRPSAALESLARLIADKKIEGALAIRHLTHGDDWEDEDLRAVIDDYVAGLRRQAEELES
ncbi:DUF3850 domain-containing protein [Litchfieldella xinjiangensis]|uniref:DUF3850 domain-containing protein n=1 Tax=Litchfieldella xinjiangensis TaxID=1166948 RepID=UPI0009DD5C71|nr:DUF3850 domain-containing protein [Halomonas xinjiangensis]